MCDALDVPADGTITYSMDDNGVAPFLLNTIARYSCYDGFTLAGPEIRVCGDVNGLYGYWNGTTPTCKGQQVQKNTLLSCV